MMELASLLLINAGIAWGISEWASRSRDWSLVLRLRYFAVAIGGGALLLIFLVYLGRLR
jgi:hypothetical protein